MSEHAQLVSEALAYRRHVGASLRELRSYLQLRETQKHTPKQDQIILEQLVQAERLIRIGDRWFFTPKGFSEAKGPALAPEWKSEDAWILLAALLSSESSDRRLSSLIAVADFIQHAIPTWSEMHGALNRLVSGGYLGWKSDQWTVKEKGLQLYEKVKSTCKVFVLDQLDGVRHLLSCPFCGTRLKAVDWRVQIDLSYFESEVNRYSEKSA